MRLHLPANNLYGNAPVPIDIPDNWQVTVQSYAGEKAPGMSYAQIREALRSSAISQTAKGCKTAVIIVDDMSRPTPLQDLAKGVIAELEEASVPRKGIHFMFALGMHRAMSREEFVRKLGEEIVDEFRIYNHNPFFNTVRVGLSSTGIPIELNADCVNADFKVGIGALFAHPNTGISGGAKIIVPGIASMETIRRYHMQSVKRWSLETTGRKITLEAGEMLGLNCKVDVLLNGEGQVAKVFAGSCKDNIEQHYREIADFFATKRPEPADLVLLNNYFKPTEPDVTICYPEVFSLVKPGGQLISSAHTPMGVAAHYMFGKWGDGGVGGLAYVGDRRLPQSISRYIAFCGYPDRGMGTQYHYDDSDPRVRWARTWGDVMKILGEQPRSVLILPYATVPRFVPELEPEAGPRLNWNGHAYTQL